MYVSFNLSLIIVLLFQHGSCSRHYDRDRLQQLRLEVKEMFEHAYHGYMDYAYPYDELRPLTCDGVDTWGSYSLSLIDALDTLVVMGLHDEFNKAVDYIKCNVSFDADINVSVFETNIRVVGGLLSAHMLSHRATDNLEIGWPCNGPLLRMAEDVARRLLPAFDTPTGMPYGTVNLRSGVPEGETTVTCTAGVGTFILEFGTLSRLTGDLIFEQVALKALHSLFNHRSKMGLMGNHLDVASGDWIAHDSGIGGGIDSYFEYLVKGSLLFNLPHLRKMFDELKKPIDKYSATSSGWYFWVNMQKGQVTMPVYQSLESYWPGLLSLIGETDAAMKSMSNYHDVLKLYGFTPEVFNVANQEAVRDSFPLRPELIESTMYLYKATNGDPYLLDIGSDILRSIQHSSRTRCGYATIKSCKKHTLQNRMESFFLAETTKYLYLLFDPDNFIHNDGRHGKVWSTAGGRECIIDSGGYIFNTEAHPIDPGMLFCCYTAGNNDWSQHQKSNYQCSVKSPMKADRIKKSSKPEGAARSTSKVSGGGSTSGHRFIMDESSVYWTQQAHDDQRPEFKNDLQRPAEASATGEPSPAVHSLHPPPVHSPSSIYRTDDQLDRKRRLRGDEDKPFVSFRRTNIVTVSAAAAAAAHLYPFGASGDEGQRGGRSEELKKSITYVNRKKRKPRFDDEEGLLRRRAEEDDDVHHNFFGVGGGGDDDDDDDDDEDDNDGDYQADYGDEPSWKAKQHQGTDDGRQSQQQLNRVEEDYQTLTCNAPDSLYTYFRW